VTFRICLVLLLATAAWAQTDRPCQFQTIAGPASTSSGDGAPATSAYLLQPNGIAAAPDGNLYIADTENHRVRVVHLDGTIATIAGTGVAGDAGDGSAALEAQLKAPQGVFAAPDGSLYIADTGNNRIRRVTADGLIHPFAGTGHTGFSGDGSAALLAEMYMPTGLAMGPDGSLYFADTANNRIRRIDPSGNIETVAGSMGGIPTFTNNCCFRGDGGPAASALLYAPLGLAVGSDGTLYIADTKNSRIRQVNAAGIISTIAGGGNSFSLPAVATQAVVNLPTNVVLLPDGSLLTVASFPYTVKNGMLNSYANSGIFTSGGYAAVDAQGHAYFSDPFNNVVWTAATAQTTTQIYAGQLYYGTGVEGGSALGPNFNAPLGLAIGPDGSLYVADGLNARVRKISTDGTIHTVAGTGAQGYSGDGGPATSARLSFPEAIAVDSSGDVYIADSGERAIRKIGSDGTINSVADGLFGYEGLALPTSSSPIAVLAHPDGDIYALVLTQTSAASLVRISGGTVTTIWTSSSQGPLLPLAPGGGMALDPNGNILLPLVGLGGALRIGPTGQLLTELIVGNPIVNGEYPVIDAIASTPSGAVYLSDSMGRIKQSVNNVSPTLFNRDLSQYLGQVNENLTGREPQNSATSLASDAQGNIYISDRDLHRIRKLVAGSCQGVPSPQPVAVAGSATFQNNTVSPGELVTITGASMGPSTGVGTILDPSTGLVTTTNSGVQVLFDGVPAPMLYASAGQINAIVPFTAYGRLNTNVEVDYNGVPSDVMLLSLADQVPQVFLYHDAPTTTAQIVINADGTLNSESNPAKSGSYVTFYMSGLGRTTPAGTDGHPASAPLPAPIAPVTASGNCYVQPTILYAGDAPGLVEGVIQVNMQIQAPLANCSGGPAVGLESGSTSFTVTVYIGTP
jgi:uncharacterized protein (TIGR03437 family)